MKNVSIRMDEDITSKLDAIASFEDRDRSYIINKAVLNYIANYEYQLREINKGIEDEKKGNLISDTELENILEAHIKKTS